MAASGTNANGTHRCADRQPRPDPDNPESTVQFERADRKARTNVVRMSTMSGAYTPSVAPGSRQRLSASKLPERAGICKYRSAARRAAHPPAERSSREIRWRPFEQR